MSNQDVMLLDTGKEVYSMYEILAVSSAEYRICSTKFSRRIILAFFADRSGAAPLNWLTVKGGFPWSAKIFSAKHFQLHNPQKLCASKIWRYTVV